MNRELTAAEEWRRGWPIVVAAAIGYGTGGAMVLLLASLFIAPMREALGWSTTAVTLAPIITLTWALFYPAAGALIDRLGSRTVAMIGITGLAGCAALIGVLPVSQMVLYGSATLMGVFAAMSAVPTYTRGVASWFERGVGLAFGIALSGSAVVAIAATPLTGAMIAAYGWRAGFLAMAGMMLAVGLPVVALFYRERSGAFSPAGTASPASGASVGEALRDLRFWCYLLSFTAACVALGGILAHLQPLLADKGFPLAHAITFGVLYALAMTCGKVVGGMLLDKVWPFSVAAGVTTIAAAGAFGLAAVDASTSYGIVAVLILAVGMAQGAEADFVAFFALRSFGMRAFATVVGGLATVVTLGLSLGAWLFGVLFDSYESYAPAILVGAGCLLSAGLLILMAGMFERGRARRDLQLAQPAS